MTSRLQKAFVMRARAVSPTCCVRACIQRPAKTMAAYAELFITQRASSKNIAKRQPNENHNVRES